MKRFSLLALLSLVAFVFAIACTDATSPNPQALLAPKGVDLGFQGEAPPPPADVAITFDISSVTFSGPFNEIVIETDFADLATYERESEALMSDPAVLKLFPRFEAVTVEGKGYNELLMTAERLGA